MTITTKTMKMLWGRAAARCSMPSCRKSLVIDETETDDPALIGELAHMVAESENGPRGHSALTIEERNRYSNLILLCRNHHREIDEQPGQWPVTRLEQTKQDHEIWVASFAPGFDESKVRDDVIYAGYIDEWAKLCHLDEWTNWSSGLLSHGQPSIDKQVRDDLGELSKWAIKRIWPKRYPKLEEAMENFAHVLNSFLKTFDKHAIKHGDDELMTKKFYHIDEYNEERYNILLDQYNYHVDLVEDLMLELTRAANLVCDEVRQHISANYRLKEGRVSVLSGPHMDMSWRETVVEYSNEEKDKRHPFPGLDLFLSESVQESG